MCGTLHKEFCGINNNSETFKFLEAFWQLSSHNLSCRKHLISKGIAELVIEKMYPRQHTPRYMGGSQKRCTMGVTVFETVLLNCCQ